MATVLRDAGWSTFWVGKNHNIPVDAWTMGASKKDWPLGQGYDRFYGFIGGETNQWFPDLAEDNHYVERPYGPEDGCHLSKDLADKALGFIRDSKQSEPQKPWYLWFCPGANHAPQEFIDKYKGKFDDGYEAYREWVLPRMIERGILPEGTGLTPINPMAEGTFSPGDAMRPWDTLSDDEKRLFSRMAEVHAGFSEYTDHQVGRIVDYLEESGQLDNTLILYAADNGASGEGSPNGSVNENKFFNAWPDTVEDNMPLIDQLGGPEAYNHYPTGWAVAFSTPYRMFKRYSYQGGVADPLVIHWPKGIAAKGEVRSQYHHCTDSSRRSSTAAGSRCRPSWAATSRRRVLAEVEFTPDSQGVIVAQGSRFGGFSLFVNEGRLTYAYNFLGIPPEQKIAADAPTSGKHIVGVEFAKDRMGEHHEAYGTMRLHIDDKVVAEAEMRTIASRFSLCGEGLCVGYDGATPSAPSTPHGSSSPGARSSRS